MFIVGRTFRYVGFVPKNIRLFLVFKGLFPTEPFATEGWGERAYQLFSSNVTMMGFERSGRYRCSARNPVRFTDFLIFLAHALAWMLLSSPLLVLSVHAYVFSSGPSATLRFHPCTRLAWPCVTSLFCGPPLPAAWASSIFSYYASNIVTGRSPRYRSVGLQHKRSWP